MHAGRYWWIKVFVLILALMGVLWMMSSLQEGSYLQSPNSPVQVLIGSPAKDMGTESKEIPAKVQFEESSQSSKSTK